MTKAAELLQLSSQVIQSPTGVMVGRWPRVAAALGRQSIEATLQRLWERSEPELGTASFRVQLLALPVYLPDARLARDVRSAWNRLSQACHYHPYELPPTEPELHEMLSIAFRFGKAVG
ncbi:MAG: hypothetical protein ACE367_25390 [Acidimicrobiales bacterium]